MARKSSKRRKYKVRGTTVTSKRYPLYLSKRNLWRDLRAIEVEDRRRRAFNEAVGYMMIDGREAKVSLKQGRRRHKRQAFAHMVFDNPMKTVVCIRRDLRRASLFARGRIGKGIRVNPRRVFSDRSRIRC